MEKYYDLVVSLVKNHRKYPEYESILNDIVNDVMQRAETICKSVDDNDVVFSYLVKLVSTSMITVPKKMGVKAMRNYNMNISQVIDAQKILQNKKLLNLFTNHKKCDIMVMPNNLNIHSYRFFLFI